MHPANQIRKAIKRGKRIAEKQGISRTRGFLDWLEHQLQQLQDTTEGVWYDGGLYGEPIPLVPSEIF